MQRVMEISFLSSLIAQLTETESINLAKSIEYQEIITPLNQRAIATSYVQQGKTGTPILLLHGFDSSVLEFRRLLPLLAIQNQTWAVDLLGFGFTDRPNDIKISPKAIAIHLYSFWKTLISQPVILIGASMGGAAAIDFTLTYPQAVKELVLIDSAGFSAGSAMGKFMFPPLGYLATQFLRHPKVRDSISRTAYRNKNLASLDAQLCAALHLNMPGWNNALISFTKSGGYSSFKDKLAQITQSTLILWGENDKILGIADAEKFRQAIMHSQLIWLKDCGHVPHLEQPQLTAQHIFKFVSS